MRKKVVQSCEDGRQFVSTVRAAPIARANPQEGVELGPTALMRTSNLDEDIPLFRISVLLLTTIVSQPQRMYPLPIQLVKLSLSMGSIKDSHGAGMVFVSVL